MNEHLPDIFVFFYMNYDKSSEILVGTSGYSYQDWLGNFYPQFCPRADFLRFYSSIFRTVEIDSTYYRIPNPDTICRWRNTTPEGFVFTAKFPSSVTHEGDIETRLDNAGAFIAGIRLLENKLGPLLLQFPYNFNPEDHFDILKQLIENLPDDLKFAVEIRNRKWLGNSFYDLLRVRNIALVQVDHPWMPRQSEFTADFAYVRFLGDRKKIPGDFSYIREDHHEDLKWWSHVLEEFSRSRGEVYAYFNNHYSGHSPTSALKLIELVGGI
nr:DUF72 domain-containing protein [candidate division Zixibacteria bacterium]